MKPLELLDLGVVEVQLGDGGGDLAVGEDTELLSLGDQALDLFEFLEFRYGHAQAFDPHPRRCIT